jgi:hypothetical protein
LSELLMSPGKKSFARVDTNTRAIAARGWGPLNYILLDHPELQETKERVQPINEIYPKQVRDGVEIVDLTLLNTEKGAMGMCMEMFLDHKVQENALEKNCLLLRRSNFCWLHGHHQRIRHWSRVLGMCTSYSVGKGKTGKGKGKGKAKSREVRSYSVEGEV